MFSNTERTCIKIGKNFKVEITKGSKFGSGFSLWYRDRWIVDASCITNDREVRVSDELTLVKPSKFYEGKKSYHYQFKKRGKTKDSPVTVRSKRPVQHSHSVMVKSK